jgi:GT2 family glycosyltransferase
MIPVMIVPILTRPELLINMVNSIDEKIDHLVVIDNGAHVYGLQFAPYVKKTSVITMPANQGVAGSWNLGIKATPFAPWWLIANFDIEWPAGSLQRFADAARTDALVLSGGAPPWCAFALGEQVVEKVGLFDEALHPGYFEDDDYARRCLNAGVDVERSHIPVKHFNSSTLTVEKYSAKNNATFSDNASHYGAKVAHDDYSEGGWSLARRRANSWD